MFNVIHAEKLVTTPLSGVDEEVLARAGGHTRDGITPDLITDTNEI